MSTPRLTVAIGSEFLTAFARLPARQQSKVSQFLEKFRSDPMAAGINYEKIHHARDPNLRSVRIDQTYRGIVLKPECGNVYLLLWVDHHDAAYAWAAKRRFTINTHTGSLQVLPTEIETPEQPTLPLSAQPTGLFKHVRDKHLLRLGVPEALLLLVRQIETDADLEAHEADFPQEAAEVLYMLAMGYDVEQAFNELNKEIETDAAVDPNDFETALENEDSQRRFHVVTDALDLAEILKAPLEKWRVFLHPSQRRLVQMHTNGPVRVLGGAGTGKTVVAMHRAKFLAEQVFNQPGDKILFTTYTRNLAEDINANLAKLCPVEVKRRIRVVNLDAWVSECLKQHGYDYSLLASSAQASTYWQEAILVAPDDLGLPQSFYEQEWEHVIQANGISKEADYLRASRLGRGQRLSRKQRQSIWPVFEEYRAILNRHHSKEFIDAMRDARVLLESSVTHTEYRAVIVDEAQDMSAEAFRLIRQIVPPVAGRTNDLFIVGDAHQRIYAHRVVLSRCGIDIRGRSRKLRLNYRTTDEIRKWAVAILEDCDIDDLDGGQDDNKGFRSLLHGDYPEIQKQATFEEEIEVIAERIQQLETEQIPLSAICVVARTQNLLEQYESALQTKGIAHLRIQHQVSDDSAKPGLRTATMHRVKGLEFDVMIIAGVNDGVVPLANAVADADSEYAQIEVETKERSLLYVAATRAKNHVLISCSGSPSKFIE
jgi:superfamily I DNA/RNA helicase